MPLIEEKIYGFVAACGCGLKPCSPDARRRRAKVRCNPHRRDGRGIAAPARIRTAGRLRARRRPAP
ncbi:hypothetical protein ACP93_07275 [Xanthomonas sp. NCPPB 1128]|nr:hypothetical protein ACP93_07275 [Xanthomonas sp. NCPPB 1128]